MNACSKNTVGASVQLYELVRKKSARAVLFAPKAVLIGLRHDNVVTGPSPFPFTDGFESDPPLVAICGGET
jgi:hypothetical protein